MPCLIKTYVRLGVRIGVIAAMAVDEKFRLRLVKHRCSTWFGNTGQLPKIGLQESFVFLTQSHATTLLQRFASTFNQKQ